MWRLAVGLANMQELGGLVSKVDIGWAVGSGSLLSALNSTMDPLELACLGTIHLLGGRDCRSIVVQRRIDGLGSARVRVLVRYHHRHQREDQRAEGCHLGVGSHLVNVGMSAGENHSSPALEHYGLYSCTKVRQQQVLLCRWDCFDETE